MSSSNTASPTAEPALESKGEESLRPQVSQAELLNQLWLLLPLTLIGGLYYRTFVRLVEVWDNDPNYSHGFVVPFFALGMLYIAWTRHAELPVKQPVDTKCLIKGGAEIALGWALHMFALFIGDLLVDVLALICILRGTVLATGGSKANAAYGFPILFLIFMAPLPEVVYTSIALKMQYFVSIVTLELLEIVGIPAFREGSTITLSDTLQMDVGEACSGIRGLTAIVALALAVGYLSDRSSAYRWALGVLSFPIAIIANCLRVFGTGLIMLYIGVEWAQGENHEQQGMVVIAIAAVVTVATAWLLANLEDWYREEEGAKVQSSEASLSDEQVTSETNADAPHQSSEIDQTDSREQE